MKTIRTDMRYFNKLVRVLMADSAIGFVMLAVGVTLMSVSLHYDILLRPDPFAAAGRSPRQMDQIAGLIAVTRPAVMPPPATDIPEDSSAVDPATSPATPAPATEATSAETQDDEKHAAKEIATALRTAEKDDPDDKGRADDKDDLKSLRKKG